MSSRVPSVARHRARQHPVRSALARTTAVLVRGTRTPAALVAAAVVATGVAVGAGVAAGPAGSSGATHTAAELREASPSSSPSLSAEQLTERRQDVSRSGGRPGGSGEGSRDAGQQKQQADGRASEEQRASDNSAQARTEAAPRTIARRLLPEYGFSSSQFECLDALYVSESNWNMHADNPTSSAYGIPQALTSTHELPANYYDSAEAQIRWGLDYIRDSYGTPCAAWEFKQANNYY